MEGIRGWGQGVITKVKVSEDKILKGKIRGHNMEGIRGWGQGVISKVEVSKVMTLKVWTVKVKKSKRSWCKRLESQGRNSQVMT